MACPDKLFKKKKIIIIIYLFILPLPLIIVRLYLTIILPMFCLGAKISSCS